MIQRYKTPLWINEGTYVYYELQKGDNGEYVLYADHIAAIAEKDRTVTKLRGKLVSKDRDIEQLYNTISLLDEGVARLKAELKAAYAINKWKEDGDG